MTADTHRDIDLPVLPARSTAAAVLTALAKASSTNSFFIVAGANKIKPRQTKTKTKFLKAGFSAGLAIRYWLRYSPPEHSRPSPATAKSQLILPQLCLSQTIARRQITTSY